MAIAPQQIGWDNQTKLYWQISKQLEKLISLASKVDLSPPVPPVPLYFRMMFDDISNADLTVGGDSSNIDDWNTFFDLPANGTPFTSVTVTGNTVDLYGGSNIIVKNSLFLNNDYLIEVDDTSGVVVEIKDQAFSECGLLTSVNFPNCITTTSEDDMGPFYNSSSLVDIIMPKLEIISAWCFQGTAIEVARFPSVIEIYHAAFYDCNSLDTIDLESIITLVRLGTGPAYSPVRVINLPNVKHIEQYSIGRLNALSILNLSSCIRFAGYDCPTNNIVFTNITGLNITLTIPESEMTCYNGSPNACIQYLQANNTVTIIQV